MSPAGAGAPPPIAEYELWVFADRRSSRPWRMMDRAPGDREHPREGWLTLLLVTLPAVSVAWSLDDAALVLGQGRRTLAWAALGGVLWLAGARAG
jgi:hypothetical protein